MESLSDFHGKPCGKTNTAPLDYVPPPTGAPAPTVPLPWNNGQPVGFSTYTHGEKIMNQIVILELTPPPT